MNLKSKIAAAYGKVSKSGGIKEYMKSEAEEKYSSKKDKAKHEKGESKKMEMKEKFMSKFKNKVK